MRMEIFLVKDRFLTSNGAIQIKLLSSAFALCPSLDPSEMFKPALELMRKQFHICRFCYSKKVLAVWLQLKLEQNSSVSVWLDMNGAKMTGIRRKSKRVRHLDRPVWRGSLRFISKQHQPTLARNSHKCCSKTHISFVANAAFFAIHSKTDFSKCTVYVRSVNAIFIQRNCCIWLIVIKIKALNW